MANKKDSPADNENQKDAPTANNQDLAKRELTSEEEERLASYNKQKSNRKSVKYKVVIGTNKNKLRLDFEDPDDPMLGVKMSEALGTTDSETHVLLLDQAVRVFSGACSSDGANNEVIAAAMGKAMGILNGIQPKNELEAMLAVQMIGVHNIAMCTMARVMLTDQTFQGRESNVNFATKMLRTFIAQMETLQRLRTGGQQKMTIKHVHVNEGGQAIVGTVNQGVAKNEKNCE